MPTRRFGRRNDDGVTLVLAALLLTSLLTISAIVVDLGYVRGSARADQAIADLAALAGAEHLESERYVDACEDMIDYLNRNAKGMPAIDAAGFCVPMGTTYCTNELLPQSAVAAPSTTSGKYTVTIEFPVPDEPGAYPAIGAGLDDGVPCDRMRVTVSSIEPTFFGGVIAANDYEVVRSATLRAGPGEQFKAPALWLLEPHGCRALRTTGGAQIEVGDLNPPPTPGNPDPPPIEGLITVDSDGATCSNSVVIDAGGVQLEAIPNASTPGVYDEWGEIRTPAVPRSATTCNGHNACAQAHVDAGQLKPVPTHIPRRATRAPVDHEWNCKAEYPDYVVDSGRVAIAGCEAADVRGAYIDKLRAFAQGSTAPPGWRTYPEAGHDPPHACVVAGDVVVPVGNWWVNCPSRLEVPSGNSITFMGGNVITQGGLRSSGGVDGGLIHFNQAGLSQGTMCAPGPDESMCTGSTADAAWVYMRNGDIDIAGRMTADHTMIYIDHDTPGIIKLSGQSRVNWTAPTEGPFTGLAAWAERASKQYAMGGGGGVTMAGAFFTPFADAIDVGGSGAWNVANAQYISQAINFVGGATLKMAPDPVTALTLPPKEGFLIR